MPMTGTQADALAALERVLDTVALCQATRLARQGRLADAQQLLAAHAQRLDARTVVLDLLAKVHAQQGRLVEAGKLWTRALQTDPANPAMAAALAKATGAQRHAPWIPALRVVVPTFLVLIVVAGAAAVLSYRMSVQQSDTDERLAAIASQTETLTADIQSLSDTLVSAEIARGLQADLLKGWIESLRADSESGGSPTCGYRVKDGDTVCSIAADYGIDPWTLARANLIYDLNHIFTGQLLVIPDCNSLPSQ
ncbi:MAG: LysM peptidoglycan-binding domain-containing protein [Chloroflexota bacterium]|nr:LysM peptidoglycan-binding domain-containing protein [Chloroflexota bacterium]